MPYLPQTKIKGYTTVALRLGLDDMFGTKISAAVYVKNLLDRLYYASGYVEGNSGGFNTVIVGAPYGWWRIELQVLGYCKRPPDLVPLDFVDRRVVSHPN